MKRSKKILIYKLSCILFAALLLVLPNRVRSYSDIRVLAIVLGIDGGDGNVTVSAQIAVPVSQNGDGKASTVASAMGGSLSEALDNLEIGMGRHIDYGHLSTVAIGKDMKLRDISEHMVYLMSSGKIGPGAFLVYCDSSPAADFLKSAQQMGESSDAELGMFIAHSKRGNHVSTTTALRFLQSLNSSSHAALIPCVKLQEDGDKSQSGGSGAGRGSSMKSSESVDASEQSKKSADEAKKENRENSEGESGESGGGSGSESGGSGGSESGGSGGSESGGSGGSGESSEQKKLVAVDSVVVFGGDSNDPQVLSPLISRGLVWQDKYSDLGLVELRNVVIDGEELPFLSARLTNKKVGRSIKKENGENVFTYKIKVKLRLDDSRICGNPSFYNKWKNAIEQKFEGMIKNNLMLSFETSKEMNLDFMGLRDYCRKFNRKCYSDFDLSKLVFKVDVTVTIQT